MKHDIEKKYFELFAFKLLKEYIQIDIDKFEDKEEPDWQDLKNSIGIEVTRNSEGTKFWRDLENVKKPVPDSKIKQFNKKFEKNGGRVITPELARIIFGENYRDSFGFNENYFYIIPVYNDDFSYVNKSINEKLEKLNDHYNSEILDNRLFIFTPILVTKEEAENELVKINNIQKDAKRKFNIIYVCLLHEIYIFDLNKNNLEKIIMDKEEFEKISKESYEIFKNNAG
ncbi:MAG TPA: hypothetical protein PK993_04320 [Clostridia bacterium]|nr:hypothetical protein [Clostridia bacterium]